jgi:hypothetical protein
MSYPSAIVRLEGLGKLSAKFESERVVVLVPTAESNTRD